MAASGKAAHNESTSDCEVFAAAALNDHDQVNCCQFLISCCSIGVDSLRQFVPRNRFGMTESTLQMRADFQIVKIAGDQDVGLM